MAIATLPTVTVDGGLSKYFQEVWKFPILEKEQEYMLAKRYVDHGDSEAAHKLVTSHLRLVAKIAMGYRGYGLPVSDLVSEGSIGLMKAVKKFDPERGFRLSTYAMWWIRASIQEYILHSWSLVKMGTTAAQKKLFFNLRKVKARLQAFEAGDLRPEHVTHIADQLNVPESEVISMNQRMAGSDHSLNAPLRDESDGEWMDWLTDDSDNQEEIYAASEELDQHRGMLSAAMTGLSDREEHIFTERRLKDSPMTLEDLSQHYNISRERIRQIEVRAFEKVQKSVKNAVISQHI